MVEKPHYTTADKLQDGTGMRVVHGTVEEVKATVAKIRAKYKVIEEDDYIAKPKGDYRSHHLIIEGPGKLAMEIQVRTKNQDAFGDWCHDVYKPVTKKQAKVQKHPEVISYARDISAYFWALDTGAEPPPKPPCTKVVSDAFGCL
jgi:ppGpp synthetase/RelA/SpoT-type nucleotidyltranferase